MRLLNTDTYEFANSSEIPKKKRKYAILSHTWLKNNNDEVTYIDMKTHFKNNSRLKPVGWRKLTNFCKFAAQRGYGWVWIDTCCIDKTDSKETQSSIHGMFQFYAEADICYAYLAEVELEKWKGQFRTAKWFKRGWTLQELIAPRDLVYVDQKWREIGNRRHIQDITGLGLASSLQRRLQYTNLTTKLSWASQRETTILEDQAYSICGMLQIKIPVIYGEYGEGKNTFIRLQKALINTYQDTSILAWFSTGDSRRLYRRRHSCEPPTLGVLAPSIDFFYKVPRAQAILDSGWAQRDQHARVIATDKCLIVAAYFFEIKIAMPSSGLSVKKWIVQLHQNLNTDTKIRVGIIVVQDPKNKNRYVRRFHESTLFLFTYVWKKISETTCKGTFGPGYLPVTMDFQNYDVKFLGFEKIHISYN